MTNKIYEAIESLPDNPNEEIAWVCYNEDMTKGAAELIKLIKGEDYLDHCKVVSRDKFDIPLNFRGMIYYSPDLLDHIGNGAN